MISCVEGESQNIQPRFQLPSVPSRRKYVTWPYNSPTSHSSGPNQGSTKAAEDQLQASNNLANAQLDQEDICKDKLIQHVNAVTEDSKKVAKEILASTDHDNSKNNEVQDFVDRSKGPSSALLNPMTSIAKLGITVITAMLDNYFPPFHWSQNQQQTTQHWKPPAMTKTIIIFLLIPIKMKIDVSMPLTPASKLQSPNLNPSIPLHQNLSHRFIFLSCLFHHSMLLYFQFPHYIILILIHHHLSNIKKNLMLIHNHQT